MSHDLERQASGGATIIATTTAVPEHTVTQDQVKSYVSKVFHLEPQRLHEMLSVVDHALVRKRHLVLPLDQIIAPRPISQISREYQEHAVKLGREVARGALEQAEMGPEAVDLLITVSCTGVMIPSLDAYLINDLGFRPDVKRLPVTELGCAAGAAALGRAADYIRAFPEASVVVVSVELPSLTFQRADASAAHLISCVLFGDGAAAALVTGRKAPGARILDSDSYLFPRSLDAMGFDLRDSGFHIVLSRSVPFLIRERIRELVTRLLARNSLTPEQLSFFVLHTGGQKVLAFIEEELGLSRDDTAPSWEVLGEYGNISSATVFFVMRELLKRRTPAAGERGLLAAFGPGFSSEMLLLEWN
jgi:alkylresorcinol/alkylpyrone synthase